MADDMSPEFNTHAEQVSTLIFSIIKGEISVHYQDFVAALNDLEFTDSQRETIEKYATGTFINDRNLYPTLGHSLAHPLNDAIAKTSNAVINHEFYDDEDLFDGLVHLSRAINDQNNNYPLLFGDDMPDSFRDVLTSLREEILPPTLKMVEEMEEKLGYDRDNVEQKDHGWEHIHEIPTEEFAA